jgi:hypothetical protein
MEKPEQNGESVTILDATDSGNTGSPLEGWDNQAMQEGNKAAVVEKLRECRQTLPSSQDRYNPYR